MQLSSDTTALVMHCAHSVAVCGKSPLSGSAPCCLAAYAARVASIWAVRAASGSASNMPIERRWDSITSPISATSAAGRRLTFRIDTAERDIYDVNLEDYH